MPSDAAQAVIDLITKRDHVSFVEIQHVLEPLIPVKGRMALEVGSVPNLVIWAGMSEEWCAVMHEVQASGLVSMEPASLLVYMVDGVVPDMPVAKRLQKGGYKTEHWAPVCFRPKSRTTPRKRSKAQIRHAAQKHGIPPQAGGETWAVSRRMSLFTHRVKRAVDTAVARTRPGVRTRPSGATCLEEGEQGCLWNITS